MPVESSVESNPKVGMAGVPGVFLPRREKNGTIGGGSYFAAHVRVHICSALDKKIF